MKHVLFAMTMLVGLSLVLPSWAQVQDQAGKRGRKGGKIFKQMDANNDRQISREEWTRKPEAFGRLDRNNDGILTMDELRMARQNRPRGENSGTPTKP